MQAHCFAGRRLVWLMATATQLALQLLLQAVPSSVLGAEVRQGRLLPARWWAGWAHRGHRCLRSNLQALAAASTLNSVRTRETESLFTAVQAGCFVADGRINGSLNLSRALGDFEHKQAKDLPVAEQAVTAMPDVLELDLEDGIEFMVRPQTLLQSAAILYQCPALANQQSRQLVPASGACFALPSSLFISAATICSSLFLSPALTCQDIQWLLQILACDGIFDVLTNQEASVDSTQPEFDAGCLACNALPLQELQCFVWLSGNPPHAGQPRTACIVPLLQVIDFVRERLKAGESPKAICAQACDHCLAEDTEGCGKG